MLKYTNVLIAFGKQIRKEPSSVHFSYWLKKSKVIYLLSTFYIIYSLISKVNYALKTSLMKEIPKLIMTLYAI